MIIPFSPIQQGGICPLYIFRGHRSEFQIDDVFVSLSIVFILSNSVDPNEMPR